MQTVTCYFRFLAVPAAACFERLHNTYCIGFPYHRTALLWVDSHLQPVDYLIKLAATLCGSRPGVQSVSPKTPKNTSFYRSPSPQGSHSPYILGATTRPRHITYVQVSSKSDQRRLRKTLHKQTDKPTKLVSWSLTSLFSTNMAISETNGHSL